MFATQCICAWAGGIALTWIRLLQFFLLAEATGLLVGVVIGWPVVRRYRERVDRKRSRH
jgi:NhaP-type Na+/H+ or K+/H+ antiporter